MQYTTTSCRNCGYQTRSHESSVPKVQLGIPVIRCPKCNHLILDSIAIEYEFMTDKEKAKFNTNSAILRSYPRIVLLFIFGFALLIGGFFGGGGSIVVGLLGGGFCIFLAIDNIITNSKISNEHTFEQAVYESLQRTKNPEYVAFIENCYASSKIKRQFTPFSDKLSFYEEYKYIPLRQSYIQEMKKFEELLNSIGINSSNNITSE